MATFGILGDIHGNLEALEAVLAALDDLGVDGLACVGDLVGYNADPDACVALLQARGVRCIAGNHDVIATGELGFDRCSNKAMHALQRTRRVMGAETERFLRSLPRHLVLQPGVLLTHAGVRDIQQYMTRPEHAAENARYLLEDFPGTRVCFFGHTHEQRVFAVEGDAVMDKAADGFPGRVAPIDASGLRVTFVNPGSVDAARKRGEKLAEYAVFDGDRLTVSFHRVPYEARMSEARAERSGFRLAAWRDRAYDVGRRLGWHGPTGPASPPTRDR